MSDSEVVVAILRRDEKDLEPAEKVGVQQKFSGRKVRFVRIDPRDCFECREICRDLKPTAVILPKDRPIPALAMEDGVPFIEVTTGTPRQLMPMKVEFCEFDPKLD